MAGNIGKIPVVGVGAVVWNGRGEVLLVRRGGEPRRDEWSIPGGKLDWGETVEAAVKREVREETGLAIEILGLVDVVDSLVAGTAGSVDFHHVLIDFAARVTSGNPRPADDVVEVRWTALDALDAVPMWSETRRIIDASRNFLRD